MNLPALYVDGNQIKTSEGKRFKGIGCSDFAQPARWMATLGHPEILVEPIINERTRLAREAGYTGPLIARMFRYAAPPNRFALDPWSYPMEEMRKLAQFYGEKGWYVDWTAGDAQKCFPSLDPNMGEVNGERGINKHTNEFCAHIVGLPNVIWNTINEPFKNGVDVTQVVPPPWAPRVQYSGQYDPFVGMLSCINLHTDRGTEGGAEKWVGKAHESAPYLWLHNRPIFYDEPMGADEVNIPGRRSNNPHYFAILGTVISMVDVVYFHSTPGLGSDGFGPLVAESWKAFCRGAQGAINL